MGVKASARGTGVGSALVGAAIEICAKWMDVSRVELEVCADNAAAINLYQKHGFVIEGPPELRFSQRPYIGAHAMARLVA